MFHFLSKCRDVDGFHRLRIPSEADKRGVFRVSLFLEGRPPLIMLDLGSGDMATFPDMRYVVVHMHIHTVAMYVDGRIELPQAFMESES